MHITTTRKVFNADGAALADQVKVVKLNALGEVSSKVDALGTEDELAETLNVTRRRGFTGHEHLERTGIIHMNGRLYDPVLGRFLSPDPLIH